MSTKKLQIIGTIGGDGNINIDLEGAIEGEANPINADTLGGFAADQYIKNSDINKLLPENTGEDEGKFLCIVNGIATWTSIPNVREGCF